MRKLNLVPVRKGWRADLAEEVAGLVASAVSGPRTALTARSRARAVRILEAVQEAVDKLANVERLSCAQRHVSTQERDVLNLAQGWARELERHLRAQGKTFEQGKGDLTPGEVRLYQAVLRNRAAEKRDDSRIQAGCDLFYEEVLGAAAPKAPTRRSR